MKKFCATQRAKWQDQDYVVKFGVTYNVKRVLESSLVEIATWDGLAQEFMEGQAMENALREYQTRFIGMLMIMIIQETRGFTPKFMLWKKSVVGTFKTLWYLSLTLFHTLIFLCFETFVSSNWYILQNAM